MNDELQRKVDRAIRLLRMTAPEDGSPVGVAYSGGKDSDVILELTKMASIPYRAIYKNTTIDPPGTLKHVKEMGVEVKMPDKTFFQLMSEHGIPSRFTRFCCQYLKEYKILDKCIMGIRRAESVKRAANYKEPTECRYYVKTKEHVEAIYPILEWSNLDVLDFIKARGIKVHPVYYREDGTIDVERRVVCMCCPLASTKKRIEYFAKYPNMVKAYVRFAGKWFETHPQAKATTLYKDKYEYVVRNIFFEKQQQWEGIRGGLFEDADCKKFLETKFGIRL